MRVQISEQNAYIVDLEARIRDLEADLLQQQQTYEDQILSFTAENEHLSSRIQELSATVKSVKSLKRKAETSLTQELTKKHKRVQRLENDRVERDKHKGSTISGLCDELNTRDVRIAQLEHGLISAHDQITSRDHTIASLRSTVQEKQSSLTLVRAKLRAASKRIDRATASLKESKRAYRDLRTWNPMEGGMFTAASRELARNLVYAGCSAGKVELAVKSCADAFGIKIRRQKFMSRRTVSRAIDEGGKYGEIQLAREIMDAPGFIESSDGTTHRGITVESRHVTLLVPSYAPDADDTDQSTWRHRTRFLEVAPALDHTAQRQFEGTMEAADRIADTYNRSPLAAQERRTMDKNEYWRKKLGESKDHAADGKKEFNISAEHKRDIVVRDLGRAAMEDEDLSTSTILTMMLSITDDDLQDVGKVSETELSNMSAEQRSQLAEKVLEQKIGEEKFESLPESEQCDVCTHVFGGCCCHKDLNVVRYGVAEMQRLYSLDKFIPAPVLLANKANAATINLSAGDPDNPALQNAIDSSASGAIKLLQLIGALLRHKDGERGYQDKCRIFMRERKSELFNLDEPGSFPDVSNTRYGCYTYAAADVVCFHGLIFELVEQIADCKAKSGQCNHVEANILKGMSDPATMAQIVAIALYGVTVSWVYMAMVRGPKENPINLLSLTDLHRKLPGFCTYIADNPHILLDPDTPLERLTLDGRPFLDPLLLLSIRLIFRDLPNPFLHISRMFAGCAVGWIQFTPEFVVGGTFDRLTPWQLAVLFILATNDCSEGMLGSFRVHMRYHPNSTAHSFSNQTRVERNNTEAFIKKCCDAAVEKYVMREVRKDGKSGRRAKFRRAWAALQREKAEKARERRNKAAMKKKSKADRLAATALECDTGKIQLMSSTVLKDQLAVYRDVLKDEVLLKLRWKDMTTVAVRRKLVLEARERELNRR
ncbi:hypothetical protein DFH06DRAFT_1078008 [Mycena polygramma]|nr:hypothetical protein DFH06DRAFT_1078008 [Mycena polygramma]